MAATNETGLVNQITKAVKTRFPDSWVMKVHGGPMQVAGIPDLIIIVHGVVVAAEVKHQKPRESEAHARGRATAIQWAQIKKLRAAGATSGVVLSVEETMTLIEQALDRRYAQAGQREEPS
jgi:hypothetical protein